MTFLNLALLAGAGALLVPLLIHLFSRRRFTPVPWGAMFLIEQVVRQNRKRLRLEQWILLAIRCAVPVALAIAMARPVITGWRTLVGDEPASAVIILDASYSMAAPSPNGGTGYDAARQAVRAVLDSLPDQSRARLLVAGSGSREVPLGADAADETLASANLAAELGPADGPAALAAAREMLSEAPQRRREIILVSDFQRINWATPAAAPDEDEPAELTFVHVDTRAGANLVVEDVSLFPPTAGVGRPVRVRAAVRNPGTEELRNVAVRLLVDGVPRDETRLNLAGGAASEANFVIRIDTPGAHTLEVMAEGDTLAADNAFRLAVDVPESLPVLLVAGRNDLPFPQNPTDFLALALDPTVATSQAELATLLRPEVVEPSALTGRALAEARVVVLANVGSLADAQLTLLREFVRGGGGLIVFPGDRAEVGLINDDDLFPARLMSLRGDPAQTRIVEPPYAHPALLPWNDPGNGRLGEATIRRWYALQPRPSAAAVLSLETGEPFIVEHQLGRGVVLLAATSPGADWSDLPLRASFLPLVQQLVTYAASHSTPPRTVWAGEPLAAVIQAEQAQDLVMIGPDGSRRRLSATIDRGRTIARFGDSSRPGFYRLVQAGREDAPLATFAVNAPRGESELAPLAEDELRGLADSLGATIARGGDGYAAMDRSRRYGREAWRWAWVAVLALLFAEMLLQGWFAGRGIDRPGGGA